MKTKLLGLLAILPLLGLSPANAAMFTYAVDYSIDGFPVTGSITTTCDNCILTTADVSAWNFSQPALPLSISGSSGGVLGGGDLSITPSSIVWNPGGTSTFFSAANGCIDFDGIFCSFTEFSSFDATLILSDGNEVVIQGSLAAALTIATATPLPAALPLFSSVLGVVGLLGWRRKRKAQAVA